MKNYYSTSAAAATSPATASGSRGSTTAFAAYTAIRQYCKVARGIY
jgi:hypothetical protein